MMNVEDKVHMQTHVHSPFIALFVLSDCNILDGGVSCLMEALQVNGALETLCIQRMYAIILTVLIFFHTVCDS
jgi:hypothetical protein